MVDDEKFINDAIRTESQEFNVDKIDPRLLHGVIGLCTESGELLDALKKTLFYNKPLDVVNVKEELGDLLWYIAIIMDSIGTNFDTECGRVIDKLKSRYPAKFETQLAENRNLDDERRVLESYHKCRTDGVK